MIDALKHIDQIFHKVSCKSHKKSSFLINVDFMMDRVSFILPFTL